jgi:hypothetical protein
VFIEQETNVAYRVNKQAADFLEWLRGAISDKG